MKYAISSRGKKIADTLAPRFGRCDCIVIYDSETKSIEFLPNPYKDLEEGVGPKVVEILCSKGVNRIISGSFGLKIKSLLDSKRIQMIIPDRSDLTVGDIIELIDSRE